MKKSSLPIHLVAVFLFSVLFILFCYLGLPVDFNADYLQTHIRAVYISNAEILKYIANPFTPVWFYPEDGRMEYVRPLQVLLFNLVHRQFPYTVVPFHYLAAIGMGLLNVVLFSIIFYFTRNPLYGWLGALLYTSFPSNYFIMSSVCPIDFQFYLSVITISSLVAFGFLTSGRWRKKIRFAGGILLWFTLVWIAIKLKSTEKIIPFICFAFLCFRLRYTLKAIGKVKTIILFAVLASSLILIVPVKSNKMWANNPYIGATEKKIAGPSTKKDKVTFGFQWKNMLSRTFYVPGGEFPFTTIVRHKTPRSFTENYGLFLGWLFWISFLIAPMILLFRKKMAWSENVEIKAHFYWLMFIWFGVTIAGFANGIDLSEIRLLNFAYVPSVILLFTSVGILDQTFVKKARTKWIHVSLAFLVAVTVVSNDTLLSKLIGHFGGMQDTLVRVENDMFKSFFHKAPEGAELYEKHIELERRAVFVDWYEFEEKWFEQVQDKLNQENVLYFLSRNENPERLQKIRDAGYSVNLLNRESFFDSKPPIFKLLKATAKSRELLKGKPVKQEILVYKITK